MSNMANKKAGSPMNIWFLCISISDAIANRRPIVTLLIFNPVKVFYDIVTTQQHSLLNLHHSSDNFFDEIGNFVFSSGENNEILNS